MQYVEKHGIKGDNLVQEPVSQEEEEYYGIQGSFRQR